MPIASKLLYFQRRPSPAPPEPDPEPPDPRRRPGRERRRRSSLSSLHKPQGQELVLGDQRDAAKSPGPVRNIAEHMGGIAFSTRLNRSVSDHSQLPDAVQQARERLLQRLNSVDLSRRRQKTWPSETVLAGLTRPADLGVSTSADSILGCLTNCFQPSESETACKVQESTGFPGSDADNRKPMILSHKPVPELLHSTSEGEAEDERTSEPFSAECSICLERCSDAVGIGLIQLRCKHVFHSACLELWLRSRSDCPYCRASVLLTTKEPSVKH